MDADPSPRMDAVAAAPRSQPLAASAEPRQVLLYNPRAPFHTLPLGLLAVASALDRRRFHPRILDGRQLADPVGSLLAALDEAPTTVCLGLTVLTGAPIGDALAVSRAIKARHPDLPVVWGGWHPSLFPTDCLAEGAVDITVQGQGEATFAELVERLAEGRSLEGCQGISRRGPAGEAIQEAPRPWLNQDELPPADYGLIDVDAYYRSKGRRQLDYISSQGCFWRCGFCADPRVYGRRWSGQSGAALAARLLDLWERYRFEDLNFQDETFFTRIPEVLTMAQALRAAGSPFSWAATLRADQGARLSPEQFQDLAASGLRRVLVGVESGSQEMLDWMQKDIRLPQVLETAEKCRQAGIAIEFPFIVGFPGETEASVEASLSLACRLRSLSPAFSTPVFFFRPYPGTAITQAMVAEGHRLPETLEEWAAFDIYGAGDWVSPELRRRVERFRFYQRIGWDRPPGPWKRPLAALARWRCRRGRFGWPWELGLARGLGKVGKNRR